MHLNDIIRIGATKGRILVDCGSKAILPLTIPCRMHLNDIAAHQLKYFITFKENSLFTE